MGTKFSLVEFSHDDGYGDNLLMHINQALGSRDMRALRIVNVGGDVDFQSRLMAEHRRLKDRLDILNTFMLTEKFQKLDEVDRILLVRQRHAMREYHDILLSRCGRLCNNA